MLRAAFFTFLCSMPLHAQDGGQLFTLYCSACHGADGKGAAAGQFPPLAGSDWVQGDPARAVKIALHGLHGEVEVDGRTFNLEMPPQGMVLPDDQIAAILTYVRSSWGNKAEPVSAELVKATRAATADRKGPWSGPELLKLHPLPASRPAIANLKSQVYQGTWQSLPDFSQLNATSSAEEPGGRISIAKAGFKDLFGMVWDGELTAPQAGKFRFRLDADDGARVLLDGKEIVRVDGIGPMNGNRLKEGIAQLSAGLHKIRVEYYEFQGQEGIALAWNGPGLAAWQNLSDTAPTPAVNPMLIAPSEGRAVVYRNFIGGTTPRAIGIGFPGGVNLAYSADHLAPELIWTGNFMDGSRHWTDRGQGAQPPAGNQVVKLSSAAALPDGARFRGYKLDPAGNPTFSVQIGKQFLLDAWKPAGSEEAPALARTLSLTGQGTSAEILLSDKLPLSRLADHEYALGNELVLHADQVAPEARDGKVILKLNPGQSAVLIYRWK